MGSIKHETESGEYEAENTNDIPNLLWKPNWTVVSESSNVAYATAFQQGQNSSSLSKAASSSM